MSTKTMGALLFLVGFGLILLSIISLIGLFTFQLGVVERALVFISGVGLCVVGYWMERDQPVA